MSHAVSLWILLILLFHLAPSSSSSAKASSFSSAKEGCPDRCGNILIPYPFGVGPGCALNPSFDLRCTLFTHPPRAYLYNSGYISQVMEITEKRVRVKMWNLAFSSYSLDGKLSKTSSLIYYFPDTAYTLSEENWLTAIGCDDTTVMTAKIGFLDTGTFAGGCISFCHSRNVSGGVASCPDSSNQHSFGIGCCRAPIPKGTTFLQINVTDTHENWREKRLFHSSYSFVGEKSLNGSVEIQHMLSDLDGDGNLFLSNSWLAEHKPMVLLDWRITGAPNCSEAQKNPNTYACGTHADCVDFHTSIPGYLCNCSKGYRGNPYILSGCQDIDECVMSPCDPHLVCTNTPGSFLCSCPEGYHDHGKACVWRPQSRVINILIGLGVGVGFMLVFATCLVLLKMLKRKLERKKKEKFFEHLLMQHQHDGTLERTRLFTAKELQKATDNFNSSRIIGDGGQGIVYKGMMPDGRIVAIKKLTKVGEQQVERLINEIVILSQINHRNVVKLLGCCLATKSPMLVYEFIMNGTLSHHLHQPNLCLEWKTRLRMAVELGGALAYLHSGSSIPVFHRDIKSKNILLDEYFVVKLADFGISKVVAVDQTHTNTKVLGTFGYIDPEYSRLGQYTEKSDVYSFGVVLVELLTRQKAFSMERPEDDRHLVSRFRSWMETDTLETVLDARVSGEDAREEMFAVARMAERCLKIEGRMRPSMREVVAELERISRMREATEMASTSTSRAYVPEISYRPSDMSVIHEISEISESC